MKKELREMLLVKRNALTTQDVVEKSNRLLNQIKKTFDFDQYECIGLYMPLGNEVDIKPLIVWLLSQNKKVVLPKVLDKTTMAYFPIHHISDVKESKFHVYEPISNEKMPKNEIDLLFIPGIAFNHSKYRLGFGAGYYDRYLEDYKHQKVGICFDFQYITENFQQSYDIPMDHIITENHVHQYHDVD